MENDTNRITLIIVAILIIAFVVIGLFVVKDKLGIGKSDETFTSDYDIETSSDDPQSDPDTTSTYGSDIIISDDSWPDVTSGVQSADNSGIHTSNTESTLSKATTSSTTSAYTSSGHMSGVNFTHAPAGYFEDALFIGDSRTVGLSKYNTLTGATFFCDTSMTAAKVIKSDTQLTVEGYSEKLTLDGVLSKKTYGKVYIMLGINECAGSHSSIVKSYGKLIDKVKAAQPNAIIYIQRNIHISKSREATNLSKTNYQKLINNDNLNKLDDAIAAAYVDNIKVYSLNPNSVLDDENGALKAEYTGDGTHLKGEFCAKIWSKYLWDNAIV